VYGPLLHGHRGVNVILLARRLKYGRFPRAGRYGLRNFDLIFVVRKEDGRRDVELFTRPPKSSNRTSVLFTRRFRNGTALLLFVGNREENFKKNFAVIFGQTTDQAYK